MPAHWTPQYDFLTYEGLVENDWPPFSYPQAGLQAQPEVQEAIQRFRFAPDPNLPLLYWLMGSGTQPFKMARNDSYYEDFSRVRGQRCGNCVYTFKNQVTGKFICSQIRGHITLPAWCRLWLGK